MKYFGLWATVAAALLLGAFWVGYLMEALTHDGRLPEYQVVGFALVTLGFSGSITSSISLAKEL